MKSRVILIAHNLRSCHNIGSLLRTAEGIGVEKVYLTGYSPYPRHEGDVRLPHLAIKQHNSITKASLGTEELITWEHVPDVMAVIRKVRDNDYQVIGLEQSVNSIPINKWSVPPKVAIVLGRETLGIEKDLLKHCDQVIEIPMFGRKESYNVVQAAAMMLYHCRFYV